MPGTSDRVMSMVQAEIGKDPDVTNEELFAKARKLDRNVGGLSRRQFNARYTLQVKRRLPRRGGRAGAKRAGAKRAGRAIGRRGRPRAAKAAAPAKRGGRRAAAPASASANASGANAELRAIFVQFARDIAAAESKAGIIDVIADVDRYVERAAKVAAD